MAHLTNNPGQQDAGEILLSGFTQMALQMEAQRRLMKPGSKPRRGKKGQKKQPQRGLGVAQLEKIRLEEQRRASQQAQHLAALRQLHTGTPLYTHLNVPMPTSTSIIPQFERESNLSSFLIPAPPVMTSSAIAHVPSIDSIANSFLFKNASPFSSIAHPSTPVTPLDLFPSEKLQATSSMKTYDRSWMDRNFHIWQAPGEGRALGESSQSSLALSRNQSNESQKEGGPNYPLFNLRRNTTLTNTSTNDLCHPGQVPNRMASPSFSLERMMELSSFQSAVSSRGDPHVTLKKRACGVVRPGSQLSELPVWMTALSAHSKPSLEFENHGSDNADLCELTLTPPGGAVLPSVNKQQQLHAVKGPNSFLSLAVGSTWQDSMAESSSTPSPVSATTTKSSANDTSMDEYMSPPVTRWSSLPNFFPISNTQPKELQVSLFSPFDASLDLTLKL